METIFRVAATVAGIAGLTTIVFYYLFREVIRKLILPKFSREHAYKIIRLILILVFLLAIAGISAWVIVQRRSTPEAQNGTPKLSVKTKMVEHVHFLTYLSGEESLPAQTPEYSMLKVGDGGYVVGNELHNVWLPDIPENQRGRETVILPEGEAVYDFVVSNFGTSTTVVDSIALELLDARSLPPSDMGMFLPVFEPFKDSATITRSQSIYPLFYNKVFAYEAGQTDVYRINVKVANSEDPGIFKCRLRIEHSSDGRKYTTFSEPFFIAKYFGGLTNRNVYSKFHEDSAPVSSKPLALFFVDGLNNLSRSDFYSTGEYISLFVKRHGGAHKNQCGLVKDTVVSYVVDHAWAALMDGTRDPVQKDGFVLTGKSSLSDVLGRPNPRTYITSSNSETNYIVREPAFGKEVSGKLLIYDTRKTVEYSCVSFAVAEIVVHGSEAEKQQASQFLLALSTRDGLDIAGLLDLMPLLAFLNNEATLNRVTELLNHDNAFVRERACNLLAEYRYRKASKQLLEIFLNGPEFLKKSAGAGLIMSGDEAAANLLVNKVSSKSNESIDPQSVAPLIVHMAPDLATRMIKELSEDSTLRQALMAASQ